MDRTGGVSGDPAHIVTVFKDVPGGYLPVGEFAALHAELADARERMQRMTSMIALARLLWLTAGFVVGLACGVMLQP